MGLQCGRPSRVVRRRWNNTNWSVRYDADGRRQRLIDRSDQTDWSATLTPCPETAPPPASASLTSRPTSPSIAASRPPRSTRSSASRASPRARSTTTSTSKADLGRAILDRYADGRPRDARPPVDPGGAAVARSAAAAAAVRRAVREPRRAGHRRPRLPVRDLHLRATAGRRRRDRRHRGVGPGWRDRSGPSSTRSSSATRRASTWTSTRCRTSCSAPPRAATSWRARRATRTSSAASSPGARLPRAVVRVAGANRLAKAQAALRRISVWRAAARRTLAAMPRKPASAGPSVVAAWPRHAKIAFIGSHGIRKTTAAHAFAGESSGPVDRWSSAARSCATTRWDQRGRHGRGAAVGARLPDPPGARARAQGRRARHRPRRHGQLRVLPAGVRRRRRFEVGPLVRRWSATYDLVVRLLPDVALRADGVRSTNDVFRDEVEAILDARPGLVPPDRPDDAPRVRGHHPLRLVRGPRAAGGLDRRDGERRRTSGARRPPSPRYASSSPIRSRSRYATNPTPRRIQALDEQRDLRTVREVVHVEVGEHEDQPEGRGVHERRGAHVGGPLHQHDRDGSPG